MKFYNTLKRTKEDFVPLDEENIQMYVCGVTPYDHSHIGHARFCVVFDMLYRLLKHTYGDNHVTYIRNFTDIDDKMIQRSQESGVDIYTLADEMIQSFYEDMEALHVLELPEKNQPRVTEYLDDIVAFISLLLEKNVAYITPSGDVNYDITKKEDYGKLSGKKCEELEAGARVDVNDEKRNPGDFALWKAAKKDEPSWKSPWRSGRPGWHIECSVMSKSCFGGTGKTFDIHGGGEDLQFPHHENEIAQSEAAHDCDYVRTWMHNAFITVNGRKMSKSLHNFTYIKDALKTYSGTAVRLWLLQTHYRKPVDYSKEALQAAENRVKRWEREFSDILCTKTNEPFDIKEIPREFFDLLGDDLQTAQALSFAEKEEDIYKKIAMLSFLGVLPTINQDDCLTKEQEEMLQKRQKAKDNRDFEQADALREALLKEGILLEDKPEGTIWRRR